MLSPNVNEVSETIAGAFSQYNTVKSFGYGVMNTVVSPLSPDPEWLTPLRARMDLLKRSCQSWQSESPEILVGFLSPFVGYAPLMEAIADTMKKPNPRTSDLIGLLKAMDESLSAHRTQTKAAETQFTRHIKEITLAEKDLDQSLQVGWEALAHEEQEMLRIAKAITTLQDRVDRLQDNLTSAEISSGKSYFQTSATIAYTLVTTAGEEIPYLSIVAEVYTIGKMAYDLIVTDQQIDEAIDEIVKLRVEASEAAQAAAMAKAIIQMINAFDKRVAGVSDHLPALDQMWEAEAAKVQAVINALESGADPSTLLDLVTLGAAAASWRELATLAQLCITFPIKRGKPVNISTDQSVVQTSA